MSVPLPSVPALARPVAQRALTVSRNRMFRRIRGPASLVEAALPGCAEPYAALCHAVREQVAPAGGQDRQACVWQAFA